MGKIAKNQGKSPKPLDSFKIKAYIYIMHHNGFMYHFRFATKMILAYFVQKSKGKFQKNSGALSYMKYKIQICRNKVLRM